GSRNGTAAGPLDAAGIQSLLQIDGLSGRKGDLVEPASVVGGVELGIFDVLPGHRVGAGRDGKGAVIPVDLAHDLVLVHAIDEELEVVEGSWWQGGRRGDVGIDFPPKGNGSRTDDGGLEPACRIGDVSVCAGGGGDAVMAGIIGAIPGVSG